MSEATDYLWDNIIPVCEYCEHNHTKDCAQFSVQCETLWRYMLEIEKHEKEYEKMSEWIDSNGKQLPKSSGHYIVIYDDNSLGLVHYKNSPSGRRLVDDQEYTVDVGKIVAYRKVPPRRH